MGVSESCGWLSHASFGILLLEIVLFTVVHAVKEQILDLSLLSIIESLICPNLFMILLFLIQSFFEHENIQVSWSIIGIKEPHNFGRDLFLTEVFVLQDVLDIVLNLIVSRINTETVDFILGLGKTCEKGVFWFSIGVLGWDILKLIFGVINHILF